MPECKPDKQKIKVLRWIPVEESLPTYGQEVITMGPMGGIRHGYFRKIIDDNKRMWVWPSGGWKTVRWWIARDTLPPMPKYGKSLAVEYIEQENTE